MALCDVDMAALEATADRVGAVAGARPRLDHLDVRDRTAWAAYAEALVAEFGVVTMLVNNAGVALSGEVVQLSYQQLEWVMDIDFWGVVHGTKELLPALIASGEGYLVNLSSLFGLMGVPGQAGYNAAKFAVRGFTEALGQELRAAGHPVSVTCVHPGGVKTAIARNAQVVGQDHAAAAEFFDTRLARTTPEDAARVILDAALAGRRRVLVGTDAKVLDAVVRLTGSGYQRLVSRR